MPRKEWTDHRLRDEWNPRKDKIKNAMKKHRKANREDLAAAQERLKEPFDPAIDPAIDMGLRNESQAKRAINNFNQFTDNKGLSATLSLRALIISATSDSGLLKALHDAGTSLDDVACTPDVIGARKDSTFFKKFNGLNTVGAVVNTARADHETISYIQRKSGGENWTDKVFLTVTLTHAQKEILKQHVSAKAKEAGVPFP